MSKPRERRKKTFVNKQIQGQLIIRLAGQWLLFLLTMFAFGFFVELVNGDSGDIGKQFMYRIGPSLLAAVILFPIFLLDICKQSHRVVGPILRLHRGIRELADGSEVEVIRIRKNDFWKPVMDDFNRAVEKTRTVETPKQNPPVSNLAPAYMPTQGETNVTA